MQAQLAILGNSLEYEERAAKRMLEEIGNVDGEQPKRTQVTPEMMQAMGIPIEIEYVEAPSA